MSGVIRAARRIWLGAETTLPLDVLRVGLGTALLAGYAPLTPQLGELYGAAGWVTPEAARAWAPGAWAWSPLLWLPDGWPLYAFHAAFLAACAAFTAGWGVAWAKWGVWAGHVAYAQRAPMMAYGVDTVLASLLFLLALAPIGRRLCLARRRAGGEGGSAWGVTCLRLIQLQVAVLMFFSGAEKLRGEAWWNGYAVWIALTNHEFANVPVGWLAGHFWLVNLATHAAMLFEVAYAFLIWGRSTRAPVLAAALLLHAGMAALMGLYLFSFVMVVAHLAFARAEWAAAAVRLAGRVRRPAAAWSEPPVQAGR